MEWEVKIEKCKANRGQVDTDTLTFSPFLWDLMTVILHTLLYFSGILFVHQNCHGAFVCNSIYGYRLWLTGLCVHVYVCVWGGGTYFLIDWLLKLLMKSVQPALQLAVQGSSGDKRRTAAKERGRKKRKGELRWKEGWFSSNCGEWEEDVFYITFNHPNKHK